MHRQHAHSLAHVDAHALALAPDIHDVDLTVDPLNSLLHRLAVLPCDLI